MVLFKKEGKLKNKKKALAEASAFFGGDGGNRNRVRKPLLTTFYECSRRFNIPLGQRRPAGSAVE